MPQIEISEQVFLFVRRQAPEPRRVLRTALRGLEREKGDIKALQGALQDFYRLRAGGFRIVFAYAEAEKNKRVIRCIFAERRGIVYEIFEQLFREKLLAISPSKKVGA